MASQLSAGDKRYLQRCRQAQKQQIHPVLPARPRGYDPRALKADVSDGRKYICSDCKWILRDPLQSFCGHRYCKQCLQFTLRSNTGQPAKCQACIQENSETEFSILKEEQTFPDNGIKREMGSLQAACINRECSWAGIFRDYETHEPVCPHKSEQCDLCGGSFKPQELAAHKESDCPAKPGQCKYCGENMTIGKLKQHAGTCDQKPEKCLGCQKTMSRAELLEHSDPEAKLCPQPNIPCVFGCDILIQPATCEQHLMKDLDGHIAGLQLQISQLQRELKNVLTGRIAAVPDSPSAMPAAAAAPAPSVDTSQIQSALSRVETKIREQEAKITDLTRKVENASSITNASSQGATGGAATTESTQRQFDMVERKMMVFERVSAVFKREIEKLGKQMEDLLKTTQENKERVEAVVRQFQPIESSVSAQKTQMLELQQRFVSSEASSYDGILVWKITNFRQRRQDAVSQRTTSFYSPCFFTSKTGYKACARIYLNGDGMGKNTHCSLFFVLMRGDYDALLMWPFQQKVTLMWLDQNRKENVLDTFRPDPTSSSFKRPTTDMNIASGCPLFMPLSTLESPGQGYVKDDVAFIKIVIDKSGLES